MSEKQSEEFKAIAYKRTEGSRWIFDVYSKETSDAIDAIAPDGGNYAKVILVPEANAGLLSEIKELLENARRFECDRIYEELGCPGLNGVGEVRIETIFDEMLKKLRERVK